MTKKWILAAYFQKYFLENENARVQYQKWAVEKSDAIEQRIQQLMSRQEEQQIRQQLQASLDRGHQLLEMSDPAYPRMWRKIPYSPFLFSYLGPQVWNHSHSLAVVGSREASPWSLQWMNENLAEVIRQGEVNFCSGGARGIDQKAHQICWLQSKPTIVVLPSGLSQIYPPALAQDVPRLLESGGVLISEYSADQEIRKHHFQARNRLISGLAIGTLIVQAERKSGTLITARQTLEQGKPLWIVPSHPLDQKSRGGLDLLADGATPVMDAEDLSSFLRAELNLWLWSDKSSTLAQELSRAEIH